MCHGVSFICYVMYQIFRFPSFLVESIYGLMNKILKIYSKNEVITEKNASYLISRTS